MKKFFFTITMLLTLTILVHAQGKTINGLKTGFWTEKFKDAFHRYIVSGKYKVIPFSKYQTIRALGDDIYEVKYKGSTPLVFFEGKYKGNISVKDGIWNSVDSSGRLRRIDFWIEGLNEWTKYYDEKGNLMQYDYDDYENDTSFYLTYINGQLFKKSFYPPENKNRQTELYYPNNNIIISDAELFFNINFIDNLSSSEEIVLSSKKDLTITSITSQNHFTKLTTSANQPLTFPLRISCNNPFVIRITAMPTASDYQMTDTLLIVTNENNLAYKIYSKIKAYHLDGRSVRALTSIQLSKAKDKYLILPSMGTVTDAEIVSSGGQKRYYEIKGITKIDLSIFPIGIYDLIISSCETGGELKFTITE